MIAILVLISVLAVVYLISCFLAGQKSEEEQMLEDEEQTAFLADREARKKTGRFKK